MEDILHTEQVKKVDSNYINKKDIEDFRISKEELSDKPNNFNDPGFRKILDTALTNHYRTVSSGKTTIVSKEEATKYELMVLLKIYQIARNIVSKHGYFYPPAILYINHVDKSVDGMNFRNNKGEHDWDIADDMAVKTKPDAIIFLADFQLKSEEYDKCLASCIISSKTSEATFYQSYKKGFFGYKFNTMVYTTHNQLGRMPKYTVYCEKERLKHIVKSK